jgi:hypothetical protein
MSRHEREIEQALLRFRPAGPPPGLRGRVLAATSAPTRATTSWRTTTFWGALAAMLLAAVCLNLATDRITRSMASRVGIGPARWTAQAEEAVEILGGSVAARRYVALGLQSDPGQRETTDVQFNRGTDHD